MFVCVCSINMGSTNNLSGNTFIILEGDVTIHILECATTWKSNSRVHLEIISNS